MIKRILSILLTISILIGCTSTVMAQEEPQVGFITVCFNGAVSQEKVCYFENGDIFVPQEWLTYYGALVCIEHEDEWEYCYVDQIVPSDFARRLFISKEDNSFETAFYFSSNTVESHTTDFYYSIIEDCFNGKTLEFSLEQELIHIFGSIKNAEQSVYADTRKQYDTIYAGDFSESFMYDSKRWVPLEELFPLINADVSISDKGVLYVNYHPYSLSQAISGSHLWEILFDRDADIVGDRFMSVTGYILDTLMTQKIERLDLFTNSGAINDYCAVFKSYLVDNEAYLKTFDSNLSPQAKQSALIADAFGAGKTAFDVMGAYKDVGDFAGMTAECYPEIYEAMFTTVGDSNLKGIDVYDCFYKVFNYTCAYYNQVDDHREMLGAVYEYDPNYDAPSYMASLQTQALYGDDIGLKLLAAGRQTTSDIIFKVIKGSLSKTALMPYALTTQATVSIMNLLGDDYKSISNAALMDYIQYSVDKAYRVYTARLYDQDYSSEALNDLRLCGLMCLISSQYAYETYWPNDGHESDKARIQELLPMFYLAADGIDCDSSDGYEKGLAALRNSLDSLEVTQAVDTSLHSVEDWAEYISAAYCKLFGEEASYYPYYISHEEYYSYDASTNQYDFILRYRGEYATQANQLVAFVTFDANTLRVTDSLGNDFILSVL